MSNKLLFIIFIILTISIVGCTPKTAEQTTAENWIKSSKTYSYDGSNLAFISQAINETNASQQIIKYSFTSTSEGYGDRSGTVQVQKPTEHTITLYIEGTNVVFAEIDTYWDELNQRKLNPEEIKFKGQPANCVDTPWETWFRDGNDDYDTPPTHEQLLTDYYASQGIEILKAWNVPIPAKVCTSCGICPRGYTLIVKVYEYDAQNMLDGGWVYNSDTETGNILFSDENIQVPVN